MVGSISGEMDRSPDLQVDLNTLSSGNALYDAELLQRIDVRRYPTTSVELSSVERVGRSERFRVEADLTFHGVTRRTSGSIGAGDRS